MPARAHPIRRSCSSCSRRSSRLSDARGGVSDRVGGAVTGTLWFLDFGLDSLTVFGAGVIAGAGAGQLAMRLLSQNLGGKNRLTATHTGVLLRPDLMLIRRPRSIDVIPRASLDTIEEQMREEPPRSRNDTPKTHYEAVLVFAPGHHAEAWRVIEQVVEGEAGLTLRAAHAEGRFVGALVKYLVRSWLRTEPPDEGFAE